MTQYTTARKLKAHRTTKCPGCGEWIRKDAEMYYFDRQAYCSSSCLPDGVTVDEPKPKPEYKQANSAAGKTNADRSPETDEPKSSCRGCGATLPVSKMAAHTNAKWDKFLLCERCDWLARAQFGLKCAGLWRPVQPAAGASE